MMEYITYAHILNGLVYQIGDFGAVALWYIPIEEKRNNYIGCHLVKTWMTCSPFSKVVCGDYSTNSPTKVENVSSTNSCLVSMIQSTFFLTSNIYMWLIFYYRTEVLGERDANSWYLVYLGTRPDARGRGYARKLVEYVTSQVPSPRFPRKTLFS